MVKSEAGGARPAAAERLELGVVLERRDSAHPWGAPQWRPVAVVPGGSPEGGAERCLGDGPGWTRWSAGTLALELFASETAGYRENLASGAPKVFVVLRPRPGGDGVDPFLLTACPNEAQDYLVSGEETVEGVAMPAEVAARVQAYVDRHHVDKPFVKRSQKPKRRDAERDPFWREPPAARRDR